MNLPPIQAHADHILADGAGARRFWVTGPAGSGRMTLATALLDQCPEARLIEPPPMDDPDASAGFLLQMCAAVGAHATSEFVDARGLPTEAMTHVLAASSAMLVVRLRVRQTVSAALPDDEHDDTGRGRLRALLSLLQTYAGPVVWLADDRIRPLDFGLAAEHIQLPHHQVPLAPHTWHDASAHAEQLAPHVEGLDASPIVWRLAIGAQILGLPPAGIASSVRQSTPRAVRDLVSQISAVLQANPRLRGATRRLLMLRAPVPRAAATAYLGVDDTSLLLLTEALAYGEPLRVAPVVGSALASNVLSLATRDLQALHRSAALLHQQLDGAFSPASLSLGATNAWIEKLHHLGHGGPAAADDWNAQQKPLPEFFWDRARALSRAHRFAEAAEVYDACASAFPDDAYAHHYLAYNLRRAGVEAARARDEYALAVQHEPTNPWWNSRRIVCLIECGHWVRAKQAWHAALEAIDPDGSRAQSDAWLVAHHHYWVAKSWYDHGVWYEARNVLAAIAPEALTRAVTLRPELAGLRKAITRKGLAERKRFERWVLAPERGPRWGQVFTIWRAMLDLVPQLPPPAADDGPDGPQLTWSQPGAALEWELDEPDAASWGAHDHIRDEGAGADHVRVEGTMDPLLVSWLRRLAVHA